MTTVTASNFPLSYSGASITTSTTMTNNYNAHAMPGAWLYSINGSYPIYYSIADFGTNQYGFTSTTYYQIMPGYKIIYYATSYFSGTSGTIDNTNSSYLLSQSTSAIIYSVRLYYQGVEITNIKQSQQTSIKLPYSIKAQYPNTLDATGLLYYYKFDTDTLDYSSGYGVLNGTNTGSIVTTATKLYNGSLYLNNGNYFQVPVHTIDQTKGYSVALWYRLNSTPTGTFARVLDIAKGINQFNGIGLYYPSDPNYPNSLTNLHFSSRTGGLGDSTLSYTMDFNWHHVCITCSINGYWTVYIDGCEMPTSIYQNLPFVTTNSAGAWYLNKSNNTLDGTANANFNQLLIFGRELKPYEVYYLYNSPTTLNLSYLPIQASSQNLLYYYPFTHNLNNYVYTTGVNDASYNGTIDTTNTIMNYGSLKVNSASEFFQVPSHYITNQYSISFWYKLNAYSSGTNSKIIILANSLLGASAGGPALSYAIANSGALYFTAIDGQTSNISIGYTMDFNWHHICLIYNGSWTIYIDGINIYTITSTIVSSLINYYYIGKSTYSANGNTTANFNQFTIFNKTLTITEINTLYKNPTNYNNISNMLYYYPFNTNFNNISTIGQITSPYSGLNDSNYGLLTIDNTKTIMSTGSLKVDSSTGVFQVPSHYITNGYTVAFWYKLSAYSIGTYYKIIQFGNALAGTSPGGPSLSFANASSGALYFATIDGQTGNISTGYTMDLNWHHICLVYNGSWTIYIDGNNIYSVVSTIVSSLINYYYIGKSTYPIDGNSIANFSQLIIMKRAISLTELTLLYKYPLNTITLPSSYYYPLQTNFNNCVNLLNPVDDSTHTGLIIDTTNKVATSGSLKVDSSVSAFQVPSHYITNGYTVAFWYKLSAYSIGTYYKIIQFGNALAGTSPGGPSLSFANASSGALYFATIDGQTGNISTGYTMDLNWHHICLVYNGSWTIYIDGNNIYSVVSTIVSSLINYYYIGKSTYSIDGNAIANFNQLAIFNRALLQSEISLLYNNPSNQITLTGMKYYYPFNINFNNYSVPITKGIDDSSRAAGEGAYIDQTTTKMSLGSLCVDSSKGTHVFVLPKHYITPKYSIVMWYKRKVIPSGVWSRIFDIGTGSTGSVLLAFPNDSGSISFSSQSANLKDYPIGYTMDLNWHHICCTYESPVWKVYIDASLCYTHPSDAVTPSPTSLLNLALIGESMFSTDAKGIGNFNQLAVFNTTLSQSQITSLYDNPSSMIQMPNMIIYYPFNNNFNNYVNVVYSGINDATYSALLDITTTNIDAGSLKVTSASNSFMVPAHNITSGYTIAFWYKLSAYPTAAYARLFDFSTQTGTGSAGGPVLFYNGTTGAIAFSPSVTGYANNVTTIYTIDLNWHHICMTYINSSWNIYIDGSLIKNMTYTASTSLLNYCSIGKSNYSGDGNAIANFNQLAIFSRALRQEEIIFLYSYPTYNINSTINSTTPSALNYVSGKVETSKTSISLGTNYAYPGYGTSLYTKQIVKDNLGNIYLNLASQSVSIYRKSTGLWTTINTDPNGYSVIGAHNNILYYTVINLPANIYQDASFPLFRYDITTNTNVHMRTFNYPVNSFIIDISNNYLVVAGFFGGGIVWFNLTTHAYVGIGGSASMCMTVDSNNNLWGGYIREINRGEANRNIFTYNISTGYFNPDIFTSIYGGIHHITIDKLDNVYAAGGINYEEINQITKYTASTGIWTTLTGISGTINGLKTDSLNNLYVSGNLTIGSNTVNFAYYNGTWNTLSYVYGTLYSLYIDSSDNFYFGGSSLSSDSLSNTMFIQYNPSSISTITTTPITTISYPNTTTNSYPAFPGCFYLSKQKTVYPVYTSTNTLAAKDDVWWVLPGYKIIVYIGTNYTSTNFIVDNTYGFNNMSKMSEYPNQVQSIKIFYNSQQLIDGAPQLSNSVNMLTNTIPISVPYTYSVSTNESVINSSFPSFPGAWMIGTNSTMPIYTSIQDLTLMSYGSKDLQYMILPGFKLILYSGTNYTGTTQTYDNTGYNIYYPQLTTQSTTKSIELYCNGIKIFSYKNYYANKDNIDFAVSVRLVIPSYSGPVVNIRNSSTNVTQDFYADKYQTYLTTGPNNTGTSYATWIGANTGYITKLYDQSDKSNHAINTANNTTQPNLILIDNKYVIQFRYINGTVLNLTRPSRPNTIFSHFYNTNEIVGTIIATNSTYGMRFSSGVGINGQLSTTNDWYFSSLGLKTAYANNINITSTNTLSGLNVWQVFSVSVETPIWSNGTVVNEYFTKIGTDNFALNRSINGYMTEMICHNKQMFEGDMIQYYNDSIFVNQTTVTKMYTPPTIYDLPITSNYTKSTNINFAISMRVIISTYTGPVVTVRNSNTNVTQDFYTDKYQTYLTTGPNNTGTTYANWISTYTGYITKMYDQSGQGNHAINTANDTTQPNLALVNSKYVIQYIQSNSTALNLTTPFTPNTIFSHFNNTSVSSDNIFTIITTSSDYSMRFGIASPNLTLNGYGYNNADWYSAATGTKVGYVNGVNNGSLTNNAWNIISVSVGAPRSLGTSSNNFIAIGTSSTSATLRGMTGYMSEMICHNTELVAADMVQYYNNRLF